MMPFLQIVILLLTAFLSSCTARGRTGLDMRNDSCIPATTIRYLTATSTTTVTEAASSITTVAPWSLYNIVYLLEYYTTGGYYGGQTTSAYSTCSVTEYAFPASSAWIESGHMILSQARATSTISAQDTPWPGKVQPVPSTPRNSPNHITVSVSTQTLQSAGTTGKAGWMDWNSLRPLTSSNVAQNGLTGPVTSQPSASNPQQSSHASSTNITQLTSASSLSTATGERNLSLSASSSTFKSSFGPSSLSTSQKAISSSSTTSVTSTGATTSLTLSTSDVSSSSKTSSVVSLMSTTITTASASGQISSSTHGPTISTIDSEPISSASHSSSSTAAASPTLPYAIISPDSCPPSQPTGTIIDQSDAAFSSANSGLQYKQYPNSQFVAQDSDSGPFFFDLSDNNAISISDSDGDTLIINGDGTFEAYAGTCQLEVMGLWQNSSTSLSSRRSRHRRDDLGFCSAINAACASHHDLTIAVAGFAGKTVCGALTIELGQAVGGGIGLLGNVLGPEVGIPTTVEGVVIGGEIGTFLAKDIGQNLCGLGTALLQAKLCKICAPKTSSTTSTISTTSSTTATTTTTTTTTTSTIATAAATYSPVSSSCSPSTGLGKSVYCCTGSCKDGSSIGNPGQCEYWLNLCHDLASGPPACSSNQALQPGVDGQTIDDGSGKCWINASDCMWQRSTWSWQCCDCPAGYTSITNGVCDDGGPGAPIASGPPYNPCVGCDGAGQVLQGDGQGGYVCIGGSGTGGMSVEF